MGARTKVMERDPQIIHVRGYRARAVKYPSNGMETRKVMERDP